MKKKILMLTAMSTLALGAVGVAFAVSNDLRSRELSGDAERTTISFTAYDIMEGVVGDNNSEGYSSADVTLQTDQNHNDVVFHHTDTKCYEFNDVYYLDFKGSTGSLYNVSEIRSMYSLQAQVAGNFTVEWGWEVDGSGDPIYANSTSFNGGNNTETCFFDSEYPNYFKITINEETRRQMANFVITMKEGCEHGTNPNYVEGGLSYYLYAGGTADCNGFSGSAFANVVIPSTVNGHSVTTIVASAFSGETTITSLTLPNTLTYIGGNAFDGCTEITALNIPKSVTSIGSSAFRNLRNCTSLTFEAGGTNTLSIGSGAFILNGHIGTLTLPSRIDSLSYDGYTFDYLTKVTEYALNDDNVEGNIVSVEDGVLFATSYGDKRLISYPDANTRTSYTIPSDVTTVSYSDGLSGAKNLTSLTVAPASGKTINLGSYSCVNMTELTEINFGGEGNISLYWYTFQGAAKLKSLVVPANVEVRARGLYDICDDSSDPLVVHIPQADIPASWASDWDGGDVAAGNIVIDYNYSI